MNKNFKKTSKKLSQTSIELVVVVIIIFWFIVFMIDIALFFRQVYVVQTVSDEVLSRIKTSGVCHYGDNTYEARVAGSDFDQVSIETKLKDIMATSINKHYAKNLTVADFSPTYGADNTPRRAFRYNAADNAYTFYLICANHSSPESLAFSHRYVGIILFRKGKTLYSNTSVNTTLY